MKGHQDPETSSALFVGKKQGSKSNSKNEKKSKKKYFNKGGKKLTQIPIATIVAIMDI